MHILIVTNVIIIKMYLYNQHCVQGFICSLSCTLAPSWTHLGVWNSDCECQFNYFCMAFHNLQLSPGIVTVAAI